MKKKLLLFCFLIPIYIYAQNVGDAQIIKSGHWIYDDFLSLSAESKTGTFSVNTPVSAGELKLYFKSFDRENLSESGKVVYDRVENFLFTKKNLFPTKYFNTDIGLKLAPELCYKSNPQIDWTYNYFYKDNCISSNINLGISDYFALGGNIFLGKNYKYSTKPDNFTNIPLGGDQYEFVFPRFAYGSIGATFDKWGFNINVGKEGMQIGTTKTGSIIYNKTFETDGYFQFTAFCDDAKYTMDIVEVERNKFLYWHEIDVKLFDKIKLGAMEGALINAPFEIRFLIPTMVFHSYAFWRDFMTANDIVYYNESHCCSYLGLTFELNLIKYLRIYGLYAMNEIQLPNEQYGKWLSYPDSLGGQLGAELKLPSDFGGYWNSSLEIVYCSPFLYIKQAPDWSLYRSRTDNVTFEKVSSWIGSPFGPDNFSVNVFFGYEQTGKWKAGFNYLLSFHGENGFNLFDLNWFDNEKGIWTYYPYTKYMLAEENASANGMSSAIAEGRNMIMSGIIECKHQVSLDGAYSINEKFAVNTEVVYTIELNSNHISGNLQHGFQAALSVEYNIF